MYAKSSCMLTICLRHFAYSFKNEENLHIPIGVVEINITYRCFSHTIAGIYNEPTPQDTTSNGI